MKKVLDRIWRVVMGLLIILCVLLIVMRLCGVSVIFVRGTSMMPIMQDGQLFLATRVDPAKIERGDVVTARLETGDGTTLITKRVIGLPGEEICIGYSTIWADGDWVQEPYLEHPGWNDFGEHDIELTLGTDEFYLMGDNRAESWCGTIKSEQIIGKVVW